MPNQIKVALIGGPSNCDTFRKRLEALGVDVCIHIMKAPVRIPSETTHVLVLRTHASHRIYEKARKWSSQENKPFLAIPVQWSRAYSLLERHHFFQPATA